LIRNANLNLPKKAVYPRTLAPMFRSSTRSKPSPPGGIYSAPGAAEEMLFINTNFPALKYLTMNMGSGVPRQLESRLTSSHTIAKLEGLTMKQDKGYESIDFSHSTVVPRRVLTHEDESLKRFLSKPRHLTLINIYTGEVGSETTSSST
jgi:hypothetical protein